MSKPRGECIEWTGIVQPNGYGRIHIFNKAIGSHRLAWALANGRAPKRSMDICHTCDNRKCINPNHLFEGTRQENMRDAVRKGRMHAPNKDKKFCKRGHAFTHENTTTRKCGRRECKTCRNMHQRKYREKIP